MTISSKTAEMMATGRSPSNALNLHGKVFGSWEVLDKAPTDALRLAANNYNSYWKCQCACGRVNEVQGSALATGRSMRCKTCGAYDAASKRRQRKLAEKKAEA